MSVKLRLRPLQIIFSLAVVLLMGASPAFAATTTLYGPKTFTKSTGAPVTYNDQFSIPTGASDFQLLVTNGANGAGDVKNVSITLNGTEVVSSKDLRATGSTQKVLSLTLLPQNELSVTLKGLGGTSVTVQLTGTLPSPQSPGGGLPTPP